MSSLSRFRGSRASAHGLSLIELLVAMSLGALLLSGLANSARVFEETVRDVREEDDHTSEETLVGITDAVRSAWLVTRPSATRLEVTDSEGRTTVYRQQGSTLTVTRPNGATGTLLSGVTSVAFDVATTRRYVEAAPRTRYETLWTTPAPAGAATMLTIDGGEAVALAFNLPVDAAAAVSTVPGLTEEVTQATLDRLVLALNYFDGSPKEFCHLHASGPPHNSNHSSGTTSVAADLYEARVPGDMRPYGAVLATAALPTSALPDVPYVWLDMSTATEVTPPEVINPPNGVAWGWWALHPQVVLSVSSPPAVTTPVDLVPMGQTLQPGRGYVLVLRVSGVDYVNLEAYPLASTAGSNVAFKATGSTSFVPQALAVPFRIEGMRSCTQTTAHDVISRVTTTIVLQSGERLTGSAVLAAQSAPADPWTGPVPGSLPALQLAGQ